MCRCNHKFQNRSQTSRWFSRCLDFLLAWNSLILVLNFKDWRNVESHCLFPDFCQFGLKILSSFQQSPAPASFQPILEPRSNLTSIAIPLVLASTNLPPMVFRPKIIAYNPNVCFSSHLFNGNVDSENHWFLTITGPNQHSSREYQVYISKQWDKNELQTNLWSTFQFPQSNWSTVIEWLVCTGHRIAP